MRQRLIEEHLVLVQRIISDLNVLEGNLNSRDLKYLLERIESAFVLSSLPDSDEFVKPRWKLLAGVSKLHMAKGSFDKKLHSTHSKVLALVESYYGAIQSTIVQS